MSKRKKSTGKRAGSRPEGAQRRKAPSRKRKGSKKSSKRSGVSPKAASPSIAQKLAEKQREISVSEFFAKNRHLLGFDNPRKALLTSVKEAVDNALDACEEAEVLPEIRVAVTDISDGRLALSVQDNGPGILAREIPNIFGKLLYGSKFHRLRQSRGQQGIGISAAGMYGLMTTGEPVRITSRTGRRAQAHYYEIQIDTKKNRPEIIRDEKVEWDVPRGTKVEITLTARYQKGRQSVDNYLHQTVIANPHAQITYDLPDGQRIEYARATKEIPRRPKEIRPHPYGVELGVLMRMLKDTECKTVHAFLTRDFSRVSARVATAIIKTAGLTARTNPRRIARQEADALYRAIGKTRIMAPPTDCVVPIGQEELTRALKTVVKADFYTAVTRSPSVYRGNPFVIEVGLAFGGEIGGEDDLMQVMRFANRVPLLYQQGACVMYQTVLDTNWRAYGLAQSRGAPPSGPVLAAIHIASAWVPFTSESKEAVAGYGEIEREIRLAIQECARRLKVFLNKKRRREAEMLKRSHIEKYLPHIAEALRDILSLGERQTKSIVNNLTDVLERSRKL